MRRVARLIFGFILLSGLLPACLSVGGRDLSRLPPDQRSAFVVNFRNVTFQPDVNVELTQLVIEEGERRGQLEMSGERNAARYVIYGEVVLYRKEGRMFDNFRAATRYELIVACRLRLRESAAPGAEDAGVFFSEELSARTEYTESEGAIETERRARLRLLRQLASRIHQAVEVAIDDHAGRARAENRGTER